MNGIAWYALGSLAALLTSFGFVPQVIKMLRTKSVRDVSPLMLAQFIAGVILWTVYGLHLRDRVIIAANLISLSTLVTALVIYYRIFKKEQQ